MLFDNEGVMHIHGDLIGRGCSSWAAVSSSNINWKRKLWAVVASSSSNWKRKLALRVRYELGFKDLLLVDANTMIV
jgi:hypothetical protein